jgi:hypothetical protein
VAALGGSGARASSRLGGDAGLGGGAATLGAGGAGRTLGAAGAGGGLAAGAPRCADSSAWGSSMKSGSPRFAV